jgi:hypothetical protein
MSRIIDAGTTFRLNALMHRLYALLPREGADEMAEEAFRYAKWNWEKTNNRVLPHSAWAGLRLASTGALIEIVQQHASGRRNPDPEAWTGTEKQITWAKSIREEARPVIEEWVKQWQALDHQNHMDRLSGRGWRHGKGGRYAHLTYGLQTSQLRRSLAITDARFWIDNRTCADAWSFLKAVEAYEKAESARQSRQGVEDYMRRSLGPKDNPPRPARVMSYAAAHRWEALAKAKGVSAVARSSRGFMRMYEAAGTWDNVNAYWRNRRAGFIARHMAQASREQLWKRDKSGKLRPSRRALALIMWAYMPPGGRS